MNNYEPYIQFDFANKEGIVKALTFTNPIDVIIAETTDQVLPCLEKIQQFINQGYYAAGYLSYEAAPAFHVDYQVHEDYHMPLLWFGIFKKPTNTHIDSTNKFHLDQWKSSVSLDTFNQKIEYIKKCIKNKWTKQVNYTIRLTSEFSGDKEAFYLQLKEGQAANYTAYLQIGEYTILSASPELFFKLDGRKIITKPMKGTIERGLTYEEDRKNALWLQNSKKNQLENKITVDLMTKELEKIAEEGSIHIESLYDIEKYPTVYQMTSTLSAQIKDDLEMIDLLKALFPSGSITGFPKNKTMKIINKIETSPREVYCGAIGYMTPNNEAVFNVPIRTVTIHNNSGEARYGVGGGITINSTKEEEYKEVLTKSALLTTKRPRITLLETFGLINGTYIVYENHLKRLKQSADYFNIPISLEKIESELIKLKSQHVDHHWKVRLLVHASGDFSTEVDQISPIKDVQKVALADTSVSSNDLYLYHKTTNRDIFEQKKASHPTMFDVLLWNENREVTEFTNGNVVVEIDSHLYTPPVASGLLAGTYRQSLLEQAKIKEQTIYLDDLNEANNIWFINSVREWVKVDLHK